MAGSDPVSSPTDNISTANLGNTFGRSNAAARVVPSRISPTAPATPNDTYRLEMAPRAIHNESPSRRHIVCATYEPKNGNPYQSWQQIHIASRHHIEQQLRGNW